MSATELMALGQERVGAGRGWIKRFSAALGVNTDALEHVLAGRRPLPESWVPRVEALRARKREALTIPPAPEGKAVSVPDKVDAAAQLALWPAFDRLEREAVTMGWDAQVVRRAGIAWGAIRLGLAG